MRKLSAILLLLAFLFNLFGYQFLLAVLRINADKKLERRIDDNKYADAELTELRVALNMPYQHRFTEFERHYGQVTIDGKEYTYVKRKIEGDVLVLKCLPNNSKTLLKGIAADITKANSNTGQGEVPVKSFVKLFSFECEETLQLFSTADVIPSSMSYLYYADKLNDNLLLVPHQPPRQLLS
ncbi:MAG: hypothetical protein ACT4OJ_04375 [Bacteroidota bacterium]